jgi:hypothetical protein
VGVFWLDESRWTSQERDDIFPELGAVENVLARERVWVKGALKVRADESKSQYNLMSARRRVLRGRTADL